MHPYTRYRDKTEYGTSVSGSFELTAQYANASGVAGPVTKSTTPVTTTSPDQVQTMYDVPTKNFKKLMAQGAIINNPMHVYKDITTGSPLVEFIFLHNYKSKVDLSWGKRTWIGQKVRPSFNSEFFVFPELEQNLIDDAVSQAYANISASEATALMMAAEGRKTVQSIYEILFNVFQLLKRAKRLDFAYLRSEIEPKELADRYMEIRYALRPLMYDAKSVIAATKASNDRTRQTFRGRKFEISSSLKTFDDNSTYLNSQYNVIEEVSMEVRAGVLTDFKPNDLTVWGFDQFIETALEVTPLSFVFNWFFNISDVICSWTPQYGIRDLASWYTVELVLSQTITFGSAQVLAGDSNVELTDGIYEDSTHYTRAISQKWRVPSPKRQVFPNVVVNLDFLKLIDLSIICKNLLRR